MVNHIYTAEEKQFLADNISGRSYREVTDLFNTRFGLLQGKTAVVGAIKRYGFKNGRICRFTPGRVSWNEGKKGIHYSPGTEFRKGNTPVNHLPIGSEIMTEDGYLKVKIAEPNKWAFKHRIVWEKANGKIQAGSTLIFADGDRTNTNLDNLILLTRAELLTANRRGLIYKDPDLTRTGTLIAKVIAKSWEVRKECLE